MRRAANSMRTTTAITKTTSGRIPVSIYQLTNVPSAASGLEIKAVVDGEAIRIVCAKRYAAADDYVIMTTAFVGDHMLKMPDDLRRMYGDDLTTVIRFARDIGYAQAQADIQAALGIARR